MSLVPKITPYDTKIIPQMYKDGYILTAIYDNKIFWHINQAVQYDEEQLEKKAMYEKMAELKRDPVGWKKLEEEAFLLLTPTQQRSEAMKILLGIQPTGRLHIGNYFGALKKGLEMQNDETINASVEFLIADFHANANYDTITSFGDSLRKLGCKRIKSQDGKTLHLFYQLAHSTSVSELARLPQYQNKEKTLHMLSYPLLMACDIIMSGCEGVIVGEDQLTHMHFYREIARRNGYKEAVTIKSDTPRIMSIKDPSKKMSKSLGDEHCIYLDDTIEQLTEKIMKAPTTPEGIENLKSISSLYGFQYDDTKNKDSKEGLIKSICNYIY